MAEKYINKDNPVYISYSWADERNPDIEDDVDNLCELMKKRKIFYKRDKDVGDNSLIGYKGNIMASEKIIGKGDAVIVVLSNKYLNSLNCMYELHCIFQNKDYAKRLFVIKLPGLADISNQSIFEGFLEGANELLKTYSKDQRLGKSTSIKDKFVENLGYVDDLKLLRSYLQDTNIPKHEVLSANNYAMVIDALEAHVKALMLQAPVSEDRSESSEPAIDLTSSFLNYRPDVDELVKRDSLTSSLLDELNGNQFVNLTGIGGMGKSSLANLLVDRYADKFNKIAYVLINGDFYSEVWAELSDLLNSGDEIWKKARNLENEYYRKGIFKADRRCPLEFIALMLALSEIPSNGDCPNLFVIDINEDANFGNVEFAIEFLRKSKSKLRNWKFLIVSREKIKTMITEFVPWELHGCEFSEAKNIFNKYLGRKSADYNYSQEEFEELFETLFYSPLLIEQVAKYLLGFTGEPYQLKEILNFIKGDKNGSQDEYEESLRKMNLRSTSIDDQRIEKYKIVGIFLSHLSDFSKLDVKPGETVLRDIVRHIMLWPAEYYSVETIFSLVKHVVNNDIMVLKRALGRDLSDKCIVEYSKVQNGYKMHGLMADAFYQQVFNDEANSGFRDYSQYFKNIIELGYIEDYRSQIAECVYATLGNDDFMEEYYWKTLPKTEISDKELEDKYNMVKVGGHDFYICKYAVSQGDWKKIYNYNPSNFKKGDNYPVEQVSWYDAMLYIMKLNNETGLCFRLPTNAEWEWACEYSNAHKRNDEEVTWHKDNSEGQTHLVYETPMPISDDHGIKNILGNVLEWCFDWFDKGHSRVLRGGSWYYGAEECRVSNYDYYYPYEGDDDNGFRLALQFKK